jgi:triosephosphate isomerase
MPQRRTGRPIVVGASTKTYLGWAATRSWLADVRREVESRAIAASAVRVFVAPSFPVLESAASLLAGSGIELAAQNVHDGLAVATGEVPAAMLAEVGVRIVEIGHFERRSRYGETDDVVRAKVEAVLGAGLDPLLCVGERDRVSAEDAGEYCAEQVRAAFGAAVPEGALVAYEPAWAIGADRPASAEHVNDVLAALRRSVGDDLVVIYGGSAGPGLLPSLPEADGLFLGRFAHDAGRFGSVLGEAAARDTVAE